MFSTHSLMFYNPSKCVMFDSYVKLPAGNLAPLNLLGIASNPLLHCRDLAMQKTRADTLSVLNATAVAVAVVRQPNFRSALVWQGRLPV